MTALCSFGNSISNSRRKKNEGLSVHQQDCSPRLQSPVLQKAGRASRVQVSNIAASTRFYNALAPILSEHGLCILPRITSRECDERKSSKAARCS